MRRATVNQPRFHAYLLLLWTFVVAVCIASGWLVVRDQPDGAGVAGGIVVGTATLLAGATFSYLFLRSQQTLEIEGQAAAAASWIDWLWRRQRIRRIDHCHLVRIAWPLRIRLESDDASLVVSTLLWRRGDYAQLESLASDRGWEIALDRPYPGRQANS